MCGIAGILNFDSDTLPGDESIKKMISTLIHRGPDGWGVYLNNEIVLGHTRLAIVDLFGGHQPLMTDRYVISYNGEVYNYIEIRDELKKQGVRFNTTSDTEVVLKTFELYGTDSFAMFNGQFALIIWDKLEKRVIIARDRYGIRPLYVLSHNKCYYFSSEMKAFDTIDGFNRSLNLQNLFEHALLWNTIGDDTVYHKIRSLPSGTYEVYEKGRGPVNYRYYEIGESNGNSPEDLESAIDEFKGLLNDSVNIRLRSDVPVGAYLSGGIDSSVITNLIALNNKEKFKTFSVAFDDKEFDESKFQNDMVEKLNTDHVAVHIDYQQINDNFLDAVYHFERPVFRTAGVPLYLLSNEVRSNNIKVVLTGEGADEILFGYDSYKELKLLKFWSKFPNSKIRPLLIKKLYPHLQHYNDPKRFGMMKMYYESFLNSYNNELTGLNIRTHNNKILLNYLNKDIDLSFDTERILEKIRGVLPDNFYSWGLLQRNQFMEMKTLLSGYLLSSQGDRMSMAHSVEGRYPFLDHRLIEKVFYYNDNFKLNGFSQKHLLGKAYDKQIPDSIINRPKKPYTAPDLKSFWCKDGLSEQAAYFLSEDMISNYGIFDKKFVARLINKFNKRIPSEIGYRDNMLITFILSSQMSKYWTLNPKTNRLDESLKTVEIYDHSKVN